MCKPDGRRRVLVLALDAADPRLLRRMIDDGRLPACARLLSDGCWMRVLSAADVGSGAVWPTFITGLTPARHGLYSEWAWQPHAMSLRRTAPNLMPFWQPCVDAGLRVGVFDLPYMPILHARDGFEVAEWGAHDVIEGRTIAEPEYAAEIVAAFPPHALAFDRLDAAPDDAARLERLLTECREGVRRRGALAEALLARTDPSLAIVSFSELHHAGHHLWHTVEPDSPVYRRTAVRYLPEPGHPLEDLYQEVDAQVGRLSALFANDTVLVCSMHGMQPCRGIPALLPALLEEWGFCQLHTWSDQSWTARAAGLLGAVKRHAPDALKRAYYRTMPPAVARRVAKQNLLPAYDWTRTSAFALPSDQHGWIRVNLQGREAEGSVPIGRYEATLDAIAGRLRALRRVDDGAPIVSDVIRTAHTPAEAVVLPIPDLIVHWTDALFASPSGLEGCSTTTSLVGEKFTGQHALDGFCLARGIIEPRAAIHVTEMPHVILGAMAASTGDGRW